MFNTHHYHRTEHVPYTKDVRVTEHRAPTDESIKILNEMEEKAITNAVKKINVVDNTVNGAAVYIINDMTLAHTRYKLKFSFNGKEHILDGIVDSGDVSRSKYGSDSAMIALYRSIALLFAQHILEDNKDVADAIKQAFWR